jgi:hypothetical protein
MAVGAEGQVCRAVLMILRLQIPAPELSEDRPALGVEQVWTSGDAPLKVDTKASWLAYVAKRNGEWKHLSHRTVKGPVREDDEPAPAGTR